MFLYQRWTISQIIKIKRIRYRKLCGPFGSDAACHYDIICSDFAMLIRYAAVNTTISWTQKIIIIKAFCIPSTGADVDWTGYLWAATVTSWTHNEKSGPQTSWSDRWYDGSLKHPAPIMGGGGGGIKTTVWRERKRLTNDSDWESTSPWGPCKLIHINQRSRSSKRTVLKWRPLLNPHRHVSDGW